ncbi:hypothetical protein PCASD_10898 [Puccinia coronata f. sp. avenae]|uniref:Uncharacterized protein n=1 Tax=Puccinia coronata f. sp. avenae TaxID=200324 RepID=A0A2N5U1Q1_9BASI|nr:hypothetical protein PCASD_10898 [Puccinia coronata f. sp. avenae]
MSPASLHTSSPYSTDFNGHENRRVLVHRLAQPEALGRERSMTLDSATGSSVETVRSPASNEAHAHVNPAGGLTRPSFSSSRNAMRCLHPLDINNSYQQSSSARVRASSHLPHLPVRSDQAACRGTASASTKPSDSTSSNSMMSMTSDDMQPEMDVESQSHVSVSSTITRRKAFSCYPFERKASVHRSPSIDSGRECASPVQIRPRLIHHSPPPWSIDEHDSEPWEASSEYSSPRSDSEEKTVCIEPTSSNQQQSHQQVKPNPKRGTGLGKLFKSVKASLRTGSTLDLSTSNINDHDDSPDRIHQHHQGNQQGWLFLNKAESSSLKPVDVNSRTALVQEESDPLDITMALDQEELTSLSSGSYSTINTATTSTFHSRSTLELNGDGKDRLHSPLMNSPDAGQPHSPSHNRCPDMSTQTAINQSPPSASCFGNTFASSNVHGRRDNSKLKLKASFSFMDNLKRVVGGGADHSLSFSFHNHNSISLPFGTVLRNNGLDPLPHCYPLPLKQSQSSPLSLNYPSSLPSRLEQPSYFVPPTQSLTLSSSSPDLLDSHSPEPARNVSSSNAYQHRREGDSLPHSKSKRTNDPNSLHPSPSPSKVFQDAPTLNLRPVSVPFAAGFSEQFLLSELNPDDPVAEAESALTKRKKARQGTDHEEHCSCCSYLASENAALKNRLKELELHIYRSQASKSKPAEA